MKKIVLAIIIAIFSFTGVNAGVSSHLTETKKTKIKIVLKNIINKYEKNNGKEKTLKILKKLGVKIRKNYDKLIDSDDYYKKDLFRFLGSEIYNIYLNKQDNSEKIVKIFTPEIYITQNKNGIGYTKIYAFGKLIESEKTLDRSFCNFYSLYDCSVKIDNSYEISDYNMKKIKQDALRGISYRKIKGYNFGIIEIGYYEGFKSILLDFENKRIIEGPIQNVIKFKKGKSGYYFISEGYGESELYFVNNQGVLKRLYPVDYNSSDTLVDYDLMNNKKIKLFLEKYSGDKKIKFEKIIKIK